jgi:DNA-binding NarL/FixJ family response regulator
MINILIVDDHAIVREGLKQILMEYDDMTIAGEASCGKETLSKIWDNSYDIVVLDISMPGRNGMEVLEEIKTQYPKLPVLVLSVHSEDLYAIRVLKLGADGYLSKQSPPGELIEAIRKVSTGRKYINDSIAEKLALELQDPSEKPLHSKLSDREYQIILMIASGKTIKEISEELSLSDKTISTYKARVLDKMKMRNQTELIRYVIEHNLFEKLES